MTILTDNKLTEIEEPLASHVLTYRSGASSGFALGRDSLTTGRFASLHGKRVNLIDSAIRIPT